MANQKQELPMGAMFVDGSGKNEQSIEMTLHRCFLPRFTSFGWGVSEEKIKMWKVNGRQTTESSHCLWQGGLKCAYDTTNSGVLFVTCSKSSRHHPKFNK